VGDRRDTSIAENESSFRDINDELESGIRVLPSDGERVSFVCECGRTDCKDPVPLTLAEYELVRADGRHFVVVPGHEIEAVERVIDRRDGYYVVEKVGDSAAVAEELDPRS
jgi:hypothetical protein